MNRMNRIAALALILALLLPLLTGCGTASKPAAEAYAAEAWKSTGRTDKPTGVGCIHYTTAEALTTRLTMPDASVAVVPNGGYAYVFAPNGSGYDGLCVVFMDENGNMTSTMNYDVLYLSYSVLDETSPAQKAAYLNACNYLAFMYAEVLENGAPLTADARTNQWSTFSEQQIAAMVK